MGNSILKAAFALLFVSLALFMGWRESAQANLKSGTKLQNEGHSTAVEVLENGAGKNPYDYLIHYRLAVALDKRAFEAIRAGKPYREPLFAAREHLEQALAQRFDTFTHLELGQNYAMGGNAADALAHYNIAFFFSQSPKDAEPWRDLAKNQPQAAQELFSRGLLGIPLMMAYNTVTGFAPLPPKSPVAQFIESFLRSLPPDRWVAAGVEENGAALKNAFRRMGTDEKGTLLAALGEAGYGFLADFLKGGA